MVASLPQASIKSDTLSLNAGAIAEFRLKRARHWQNAALTHNVTGDLSWTGSAHKNILSVGDKIENLG
jgi:hypothetical protein